MNKDISHWLCTAHRGKCCGCFPHKDCTYFVIERTGMGKFCGRRKPVGIGSIRGINKFIDNNLSILLGRKKVKNDY